MLQYERILPQVTYMSCKFAYTKKRFDLSDGY